MSFNLMAPLTAEELTALRREWEDAWWETSEPHRKFASPKLAALARRCLPLFSQLFATIERDRKVMQQIMQVLGPEAVCECQGCSWETNEAIRLLQEAGIAYIGRKRPAHDPEKEQLGNTTRWCSPDESAGAEK